MRCSISVGKFADGVGCADALGMLGLACAESVQKARVVTRLFVKCAVEGMFIVGKKKINQSHMDLLNVGNVFQSDWRIGRSFQDERSAAKNSIDEAALIGDV